MTSTPSPTWYDVLGVSRTASPDQIKAAWRLATDKFEPGTGAGQFRMFNEAADVLLDPVRRAAYDATLDDPNATSEPPPPLAPAETDPTPHVDPKAERRKARARRREEKQTRTADRRMAAAPAAPASRRSVVVAAVLAVLAVAAVVVAVLVGLKVRTDNQVADARQQAPAAAEQAAKAIFAYDYRNMPADLARAKPYLTDNFAADFTKNFKLLEKQDDGSPGPAIQTKTVVKSDVPATSVVDAENGVVRVLAYVNLTSTRPGRDPQIFQNRVTMKMVKQGDRWLVDKVDTY
jgi:Mce-associated membrane protein